MTQFKTIAVAVAIALALPTLGLSAQTQDGVKIVDPYARSAGANAVTGAAFMTIENHTDQNDRLIAVRSDAAERAELHTHLQDGTGVMRMIAVEDGIVIPANGRHVLDRGGDHIMFLGLTAAFEQGRLIPVTLVFERAGEITVEIPVDLERMPMHGQVANPEQGG